MKQEVEKAPHSNAGKRISVNNADISVNNMGFSVNNTGFSVNNMDISVGAHLRVRPYINDITIKEILR